MGVGCVLGAGHSARIAAHVHQDDGAAEGGGGGEHVRVELPGADVVDDVGACCDGGVGDGGAEGVDADGDGSVG